MNNAYYKPKKRRLKSMCFSLSCRIIYIMNLRNREKTANFKHLSRFRQRLSKGNTFIRKMNGVKAR